MKLITAIVNKEDSKNVCNELIKAKFYVTRLATTGGFLMAGNMTLLIGTEDERVDDCIKVISRCCKQRTEIVPGTASIGVGLETAMPIEVTVGGATIHHFGGKISIVSESEWLSFNVLLPIYLTSDDTKFIEYGGEYI